VNAFHDQYSHTEDRQRDKEDRYLASQKSGDAEHRSNGDEDGNRNEPGIHGSPLVRGHVHAAETVPRIN
jgi:hypothetical protein